MPKVTIRLSPTGEATVTTEGYHGKACKDATKEIEKALGKTTSDVKKPEYYQQAQTKARQA